MSDVFITRRHEPDNTDYSNDAMPKCPICGAKPFVSRNIVDGFYYGWGVGCPRYCIDDGIHNNPKEHLTNFFLNNKEECIEWWKQRVKKENEIKDDK